MANYLKDLWSEGSENLQKGLQQDGENILQGTGRSLEPQLEGQTEEDKPNWMLDVAAAPFRGIEGGVHGLYNLADMLTFDALPDWDDEDRILGRSKTMAGGFVEGMSQFLIPFFYLKGAMKAGKLGKKLSKLGSKRSELVRDISAGAVVDFAVFDGHEQRLSNLVQMFPKFGNPVSEYLAADENDSEAEGRFKNVIEGLLIEAGMRGAFRGVVAGVKSVKLRKQKLAEGKSREVAEREAIEETDIDDLKASDNDLLSPLERGELPSDDELKSLLDLQKTNREEFITRVNELEDEFGDEVISRLDELSTPVETVKEKTIPSQQGFNFKDMSWNEIRAAAKKAGLSGQGTKADLIKRLEDNQNPRPNTDLETGQGQLLSPDQAVGKEPNFRTSEVYKEAQRRRSGNKAPVQGADVKGKQQELDFGAKQDEPTKGEQSVEQDVMGLVKKFKAASKKGDKGRGLGQALAGSVRNVANTGGMMRVAKALAIKLEEDIDMNSKNIKELEEEARDEAINLNKTLGTGTHDHDYLNKISDAMLDEKDQVIALKRVRAQQQALRELNIQIGQEMRTVAEQYHKVKMGVAKGDLDKLEVQLMGLLEKHRETQRIWSIYGRDTSYAFLQRKEYYSAAGKYNRRLSLSEQELGSAADRMSYKRGKIGAMKTEELVNLIRKAANPDKVIGGIQKQELQRLNEITKATNGQKFYEVTMEYWMNSLLSSPATQVVNALGNTGMYMMHAAEGFVGAAAAKDPVLMKVIAKYVFKIDSVKESWAVAKQTWFDDEAKLIADARVYDDAVERSHAIYKEGEDAFSNMINYFGAVVRSPSRLLLMGDEFFKQMNYRFFIRTEKYAEVLKKTNGNSYLAAKKADEALQMSLTGQGRMLSEKNIGMEAYKLVNKQDDELYAKTGQRMSSVEREHEMKRLFEAQGRNLRNGFIGMDKADAELRLPDAAADYARIATATKDIPQIQEPLSRLAHHLRWTKMVFPFVRTPTNLLKMGFERTVLGGGLQIARELSHGEILKQFREIEKTGTPRQKAQLYGKISTAIATTTALTMYVGSNSQFISGAGPRSRDEREALRMSGWQPYSIKVGDTWLSYNRMDPIATTLGICADIANINKYYDVDDNYLEGLLTTTFVAFTNNITNKSFVDGLDNLFKLAEDPTTYGKQFIGSLAGGFVPNIANQLTNNLGEDRALADTRRWFDYVLKRLPSGAASMPPKRNFLGEAQFIENGVAGLGIVNPLYISYASDNPEDLEISRLLHGFSMPESKLSNANNLDLKLMTTPSGQDAYDRMLELQSTVKLGGKTLREQIRKLVQHPAYLMLPEDEILSETGLQSPRVKEIQRVVRLYRAHAKQKLMDEMPSLKQAMLHNYKQRADYLLNQD